MKREVEKASEKKQPHVSREVFREEQDIERERYRKKLQERGSNKNIRVIKWIVFGAILVVLILGLNEHLAN